LGDKGSVSKVEMKTWMALIYKALFLSISTFETPPYQATGTPPARYHSIVIPDRSK
jgi:hypothetical protein